MIKTAVMLISVFHGGVSISSFSIPGYSSLNECKASQERVSQQLMKEPFIQEGVEADKRSLPERVRTKCVEI